MRLDEVDDARAVDDGPAVTATVGDLGESLIKRDLQIKDMSQLLPGHGGLLDRVEELLEAQLRGLLVGRPRGELVAPASVARVDDLVPVRRLEPPQRVLAERVLVALHRRPRAEVAEQAPRVTD